MSDKKELKPDEVEVLKHFNKGFEYIKNRQNEIDKCKSEMNDLRSAVDRYKTLNKKVEMLTEECKQMKSLLDSTVSFYEKATNVGVGNGDLFNQHEEAA